MISNEKNLLSLNWTPWYPAKSKHYFWVWGDLQSQECMTSADLVSQANQITNRLKFSLNIIPTNEKRIINVTYNRYTRNKRTQLFNSISSKKNLCGHEKDGDFGLHGYYLPKNEFQSSFSLYMACLKTVIFSDNQTLFVLASKNVWGLKSYRFRTST